MELELTNSRVVAVDGGTATGKSRLVEELAALLRLRGVPVLHVSSGHLYRAVTYAALQLAAGREPPEAVERVRGLGADQLLAVAREHEVAMHNGAAWIDGGAADVEGRLKAPGVGAAVSHVASFLAVRQLVNVLIRRQVNEFDGYVLIDGRDITHTVVPDAPLKLLLVVSPQVAAQRSREHTQEGVVARDTADRAHAHGALRHPDDPGEGVRVLATDEHTPESLRDEVYELMRGVFAELPEL
jgi:cytidylate kinase